MRKLILKTCLGIALLAYASPSAAQSQNDRMARAYYFEAESAVTEKRYEDALAAITQTETLLGSSNPSIAAMKVKIYFGQEKYSQAKSALDQFFTYDAGDNLTREMSSYLLKIDSTLKAERDAAEKEEKWVREEIRKYFENDFARVVAEADAYKKEAEQIKLNGQKYKRDAEYRERDRGSCISGDCQDFHGVYIFRSGAKYEGQYEYGKRHGDGIYFFDNGAKYEGPFVRGESHTGDYEKGTIYYANGNKYVGAWKNDYRTGKGTYYFASGHKRVGDFYDGKLRGDGHSYYPDGGYYYGPHSDSKRHGKGLMIYHNQQAYYGEYKNGTRHGHGTYYYNNGTKKTGQWADGDYVGP